MTDHKSITRNSKQHRAAKAWGEEVWLANSPLYCGKRLFIRQGYGSSMHFHVLKTETIVVESGSLELKILEEGEETRYILFPGDSILITPGLMHQLIAKTEDVVLYEFSTQHFDSDSYRIRRYTPAPPKDL